MQFWRKQMRVISGSARGTVLHSIEDVKTRPTLDRVKESLFNIIQNDIRDAVILDLFSGSGAIAIEFLSRGAKEAYICDNSSKATEMINKNLEKTRLSQKAIVYKKDYIDCLNEVKNVKFDIIFLDPPYKENLAIKAVEKINNMQLLKNEGIIIIETDEPERDIKQINDININYKMYDLRKYGRASLIFLK
jgi:16S rRNA (guanine966-N2)-methyltransferase